jgi:MFS family permease
MSAMAAKGSGYRYYMLWVLMAIHAMNYVDRKALGLLLQSIKVDLALTDTQLGFLTGIAFALFYSVLGIPIARWADRGNRVTIVALTTGIWSVMVCLCGTATSFAQLLLIRIGVAVGEAGCIPPAHSLIADYFERTKRAGAVSIYMLGAPIAVVIGFLVTGWLNNYFGWRTTLILLGLPGVVLALLAWFTLIEPRLASQPTPAAASTPQPSFKEVLSALWAIRTFRHLLVAFAILAFFGYGINQWKPSFFIRSYGLDTATLGTWLAGVYGFGGILGTYLGGMLAERYAANNEALQLRTMAIAYTLFALFSAGVYLAPTYHIAFGLMFVATVGVFMINGPLFAAIQTLVPERMRALSIAIIYLFANLIGMGLGPLSVGILSDAFMTQTGQESLRYALLALCPGYIWVSWHMWRASKTIAGDLRT